MVVLKRRDFAKWQAGENLSDNALCDAVAEMENGLVDADLGGNLYKKRVARAGGGKSSGRTLLSAKLGDSYVFLIGFAKSARANITAEEKRLCVTRAKFSLACLRTQRCWSCVLVL
jgi:hypothetical protein